MTRLLWALVAVLSFAGCDFGGSNSPVLIPFGSGTYNMDFCCQGTANPANHLLYCARPDDDYPTAGYDFVTPVEMEGMDPANWKHGHYTGHCDHGCLKGACCPETGCALPVETDVPTTDNQVGPDAVNDKGMPDTTCTPSCGDRTCGDDGCGGTCGTCGTDSFCADTYQCEKRLTTNTDGTCHDNLLDITCDLKPVYADPAMIDWKNRCLPTNNPVVSIESMEGSHAKANTSPLIGAIGDYVYSATDTERLWEVTDRKCSDNLHCEVTLTLVDIGTFALTDGITCNAI